MTVSAILRVDIEGSLAVLTIDRPPVNALSQQLRVALLEQVTALQARPDLTAIVLAAAGPTFPAGAEISEFELTALPAPDPNEVHAAIEGARIPVVACLHGTVLGGGLELALACHYRIAAVGSRLGMPEIKLGLLPGAGGTWRLTRLCGAAAALRMMARGEPVDAEKALALDLVHRVVDGELLAAAKVFAREIAARRPLPRSSTMPPAEAAAEAKAALAVFEQEAPQGAAAEIAACVRRAHEVSFAQALQAERAAFERCRASAESQALRHLFFAERKTRQIPGLSGEVRSRPVRRVGIVGAGTMGGGIAMNFANAGIPVRLVDVSAEALQRGLERVFDLYEGARAKGRLGEADVATRRSLITGHVQIEALSDCDLVIEAAFEDLEVKRALCATLGEVCKPGAVIATNTSTLDVDVLAQASGRPADFLGMHFFSPANVMRLLEVVRGRETAPDVLATALQVGRTIGKTPVVSGVCWGFIGNRMLEPYLREAEALLLEGATPAQVDGAIEAVGLAMGPCRMIDLAGVDVASRVVLERDKAGGLPPDPAYRAVVRALHERNRLGQKVGAGYYAYEGRKAMEDPDVQALLSELAWSHGIRRRQDIDDREIVERCLYSLVNEGARILEDGIAYRAGDIDVVWTHGYGFPARLGGPMHWAAEVGLPDIVRRLDGFAQARGHRFGYWSVSPLLRRLASEGASFR